jgi:hypothetical protein
MHNASLLCWIHQGCMRPVKTWFLESSETVPITASRAA